MSTTVFPFALSRMPKAIEVPTFKTRIVAGNEGSDQRAADYGGDFKLRVVGTLRLPQPSTGKTLADWLSFAEARLGQYDAFLFKCFAQRYRGVTALSIGTGDGVTTDFPLIHKYIDASTLLVYDNAGAAGSNSLVTNNTTPIVRFSVAPTSGHAITATYDFYFPVFLANDGDEPVYLTGETSDATRKVRIDGVELHGTIPGGHLV